MRQKYMFPTSRVLDPVMASVPSVGLKSLSTRVSTRICRSRKSSSVASSNTMLSPVAGCDQLSVGWVLPERLLSVLFQTARPSAGAVRLTEAGGVPLPHSYVMENEGALLGLDASAEWKKMPSLLV